MACSASGRSRPDRRMDRGLGNVRVQARIAEIMRAGAERAEVTVEQVVRELKLIGFSDIRKVVSWRNELVTRTEKGEDGEPVMVLMPRVTSAVACCSAVLTGTNRIVGRPTASQIASASAASCLLRLMYAFTECAGISRTSCPSAPSLRAQ